MNLKTQDSPNKTNNSRRQFLKATSATLAAPTIIPATALGKDGRPAPSNRIVMGAIGTGGMGRHDMNVMMSFKDVQVVAVCDVDKANRTTGLNMVHKKYGNKDAKPYHDYRKLVARKDIDAVTVTTPDHWHALASVAALNSGKDVYCEKPLANSIAESRAILDAQIKNKRILQCGSHERSNANGRYAAELVRNGRIGKLKTVRINLPCDQNHHKQAKTYILDKKKHQVPAGFDFDTWLGHTPKVPYHPRRCHFWWRFILAYGGGEMTDRGAHVIDLAQLGMNTDDTGPVEISAKGAQSKTSFYDAYWDFSFVNKFANGITMIGTSDKPRGLKYEGTDGWIFVHVHGCKLEASDPKILKEKIGPNEINLGRSPGHQRNFIDCVKSRKQPFAHAGIGHHSAVICHLNNIAMKTGKTLKWDPKKEKITNDSYANSLCKPVMRKPWAL